jgi:DNA-binding IscR family transcriptional regulator
VTVATPAPRPVLRRALDSGLNPAAAATIGVVDLMRRRAGTLRQSSARRGVSAETEERVRTLLTTSATPLTVADIAEAIGISLSGARFALHELTGLARTHEGRRVAYTLDGPPVGSSHSGRAPAVTIRQETPGNTRGDSDVTASRRARSGLTVGDFLDAAGPRRRRSAVDSRPPADPRTGPVGAGVAAATTGATAAATAASTDRGARVGGVPGRVAPLVEAALRERGAPTNVYDLATMTGLSVPGVRKGLRRLDGLIESREGRTLLYQLPWTGGNPDAVEATTEEAAVEVPRTATQTVSALLNSAGQPLSARELVAATGLSLSSVRRALARLGNVSPRQAAVAPETTVAPVAPVAPAARVDTAAARRTSRSSAPSTRRRSTPLRASTPGAADDAAIVDPELLPAAEPAPLPGTRRPPGKRAGLPAATDPGHPKKRKSATAAKATTAAPAAAPGPESSAHRKRSTRPATAAARPPKRSRSAAAGKAQPAKAAAGSSEKRPAARGGQTTATAAARPAPTAPRTRAAAGRRSH